MTDLNPQLAYDQIAELKEQRDRWLKAAGDRVIKIDSLEKQLIAANNGCDEYLSRIKKLEAKYETAKSAYLDLLVNSMNEAGQDRVRIQKLEAQLTPETELQDDHPCVEDDGCPTEGAVLKREWRRLTAQLKAVRECQQIPVPLAPSGNMGMWAEEVLKAAQESEK
jgi:chromosome segregation ATPase